MADRLPAEFKKLVQEYGWVEEFYLEGWFERRLRRLWAMTPKQRRIEVDRRKAEMAEWENSNNATDQS